jgi:hypothetical protein
MLALIMKNLILFLFVAFLVCGANAQMRSDGKWYFPTNVKDMCVNTEQNLIASYKSLIERNREWLDENLKTDKSGYPQLTESLKKAIVEYETSWDRLGCAGILYGTKK